MCVYLHSRTLRSLNGLTPMAVYTDRYIALCGVSGTFEAFRILNLCTIVGLSELQGVITFISYVE